MKRWTGVVLALTPPGRDSMVSRLPTYLHPLAGRPLIYHALRALAERDPAPHRIFLVGDAELRTDWLDEIPFDIEVLDPGDGALLERFDASASADEEYLVVDGAAPMVADCLDEIARPDSGQLCVTGEGEVVAARVDGEGLAVILGEEDHLEVLLASGRVRARDSARAFVVRRREDLARATARCRDRIVESLMEKGVTFMLPETVLVDLDVTIGADAVIYPHVVLEGDTSIGPETVIGPGCRIVNSRIGSGVELKGWNYISHTSIRNRAILEPYVRRGYD